MSSNPLVSRLKSTLIQQTQNLKFNILINSNLHNHPGLIVEKQTDKNNQSYKKKNPNIVQNKNPISQQKRQIQNNQIKMQLNMENKLTALKKRSYSQKKLNTHENFSIQKQHKDGNKSNKKLQSIERTSFLIQQQKRPRLISSASSGKLRATENIIKQNGNLELIVEKHPISNKQFLNQKSTKNVLQQGGNNLPVAFNNDYASPYQNSNVAGLKNVKYVTPIKSDRYPAMNFSIDPSASKKAIQNKVFGLPSNQQKNAFSQLAIVASNQYQSKKANQLTRQQKIANHVALFDSINSSLVLYIKDSMIVEQNVDYKQFLQIIQKKKQKSLLIGQNLESRIQQIKAFIKTYSITSQIIQVRKIFELQNKRVISNWNILNLFSNWKNILQQTKLNTNKKIPGIQYYYPSIKKGKRLAALKITKFFRSIKERKIKKNLLSLMSKVITIQRYWKKALLVKRHHQLILNQAQKKLSAFTKIQQKFIKNYDIIKTSKKVQIHIGSLMFQQFKRITIENKSQYENIQLSRIFKALENPDIFIIFVTPIQLSDSVIKYYQRLFKIVTNNDNALKEKVYFIYPENTQRLSDICQLSTLSSLLYSPKALKRIKSLVKSISSADCAYIIPSYPSIQYTNLSYQLNVPIFSSSLSQSKLFSTKIAFRQIINSITQKEHANPPFKLLKSVSSIFSQKQLINTLALLIYKNQQIKRWYLKIDDQVDSRGLAYFNVNSINLFKKINNQENDDVLGDVVNDEKELIKIIVSQLKDKFKQRLKILHKNVYPNYQQYITHFLTRGGVIQAAPDGTLGDIKQMSISFLIEPNGDFQILGTYKKLQLNSKSICNSIQYPCKIPNVDIQKIVRHLYRRLYIKMKFFGYFTVDLLVTDQKQINQKENKLTGLSLTPYVIGMNFYLNYQTSGLFLIKQLSKVKYQKDTNNFVKFMPLISKDQTSNYSDTYSQRSLQSSKISRAQFQKEQQQLSENYQQDNEDKQSVLLSQSKVAKTGQSLGQDFKVKNKNKIPNQITFLYCPKIILPNLQTMSQFFKKCKYENISFDLKSLLGTFFLPLDDLECQNIGFITSQKNIKSYNQQLLRVLDFLSKNYRKKHIKGQFSNNTKGNTKLSTLKKQSDQVGLLRGVVISQIHKSQQYKAQQKNKLKNNQATFNNLQIF